MNETTWAIGSPSDVESYAAQGVLYTFHRVPAGTNWSGKECDVIIVMRRDDSPIFLSAETTRDDAMTVANEDASRQAVTAVKRAHSQIVAAAVEMYRLRGGPIGSVPESFPKMFDVMERIMKAAAVIDKHMAEATK